MMYDVIVLGATFAAAGIARQEKEKCLIIERRLQAGYEFLGTLRFGSGCDTHIYSFLQEANVLFATEIVSVKREDGGFVCTTHGVDGFCTYQAKRVVDTRSSAEISISKTFNLLIESEEAPSFLGIHAEKADVENRYVLRCPVPLFCGYAEARRIACHVIRQFSETQRLILLADEFDYRVKVNYPKEKDGILYLPSKAYETPQLALEGLGMDEEAGK